jgi:hypothetical protein
MHCGRRGAASVDVDFKVTPEYDNGRFVPARLHIAGALEEIIEVGPHRSWDAAEASR